MRANGGNAVAWQLRMFDRSLKKRQKVGLILELLGPVRDERCLLITGGDNNGAMNYHLREAGGHWRWAEMEAGNITGMEALLGERIEVVTPDRLPFADEEFDRVIVVDVHEHVGDVGPLNREMERVLAPGGLALVTTPNGDTTLPLARLKRTIGMGPGVYGHVVQGYTAQALKEMLRAEGLTPERQGAYSRFFTELAELVSNFAYVKLLSGRGRSPGSNVGIAPTSEEQLRKVEKSYRIYSAIYPLVRTFSLLDHFVPGEGGYAVAVTARKPR